MGITTLVFQMEFDLQNAEIPYAITSAVNELRGGRVSRIEISIVERSHGRQLRIEGRKEEEAEKGSET
ncbi:hypothetical protein LCGC14_2815550 [marine sediment metagenome]|uniref:Uncharacterized protein n=1 Tax=marine sediment metagenome TaxID=412755 RepID=A0A0F8YIK3_9ZZZZ